jgi:ABC-type sugar transport system ATPase subunit
MIQDSEKILLQANGVSKRYFAVQALNDASIEIHAGEVHALIGSNGAGKSTLVKILTGAVVPDTGEVLLGGTRIPSGDTRASLNAGIACIYQESNLVPALSVMENIMLGRQKTSRLGIIDNKSQRVFVENLLKKHNLNLDPDAPVQSLSTVQLKEVEIAKALSMQAKVILMDEPTAWLSRNEVEKLFESIRGLTKEGVGVLYISHVLDEIFTIADRATVIRDGKVLLTTTIKETNKNALVQAMLGRQLSTETIELQRMQAASEQGDVAIECKNLRKTGLFEDVSFNVHRNEIVCITGLLGSKRTDLVRTLFGSEVPDAGEVYVNGELVKIRRPLDAIQLGMGLVPEDRRRDGLLMNLSINHNLVLAYLPLVTHFGLISWNQFKNLGKKQIDELGILPPRLDNLARNLSGGNQQKVLIGRWLAGATDILILDEPTVGVDVGAKADIYKLLRSLAEAGTAILIVSSDMEEVLTIADRVLVMANGRMVASFLKGQVTQEQILNAAAGRRVNDNRPG